ncbi:MAG: DUF4236 domain-containing protein [Sphaerochaetaceae bacterium]
MGVRFHRSVKIVKGVRLNISKKGLGVSVGPRGAKVSFGPSGMYTNVGVPGTGLYIRNKINSSTRENSNTPTPTSTGTTDRHFDVQVSIDDETGIESVKMFDRGQEVTDVSLLRKLRAEPIFKERLTKLREKTQSEIEEKTNVLIQIHKYSSSLPDWDKVREDYATQSPKRYERRKFSIEKPTKENAYQILEDEAYKTVKAIFGLKKKREEFIEQRLEKYFEGELIKWQREKDAFEEQEDEIEVAKNNQFQEEFNAWKSELQSILQPTVEFISQKLNEYLSVVELPVEFSVSFDVLDNGRKIYLDIDLPEIEDFPQKKSRILSTGKLSLKNKTPKEMKLDYLKSVSGMSIYFASIGFSISPKVEEVIVSGYTQRINKATGNVDDEYVYSVKYDYLRFKDLDVGNIEPNLTLESFEHRIDSNSQYDLRPIIPFEINV